MNFLVKNIFYNNYFLSIGIIEFIYCSILIVVNMNREKMIKIKNEQIIKVYQALSDILGRINIEDIDFSNVPFKIEENKEHIVNKIIIDTSLDIKVNENTVTLAQYSINKFIPELQWISKIDYSQRELTFKGLPKPPQIAKFPGSDYRPTGWVPLGVNSEGEVGWNMSDPKDLGSSSYVYEDGKIPNAVKMPSAPQCLTLGSPLSLDTIIPTTKGYKTMKNIEVGDYVFDIFGKPSQVLGLSPIKLSNKMFKITLKSLKNNEKIIVKSDEVHKFPVFIGKNRCLESIINIFHLFNSSNIIFYGKNNKEFIVENICEIKNEFVRCILVDSDTHLFLITDEKNKNWNGGKEYNFKACATSNTGGGKSIWVNQEIDITN